MAYTVIGARGFVGRHAVAALERLGEDYRTIDHGQPVPTDEPLGHVLYCAGITADFRTRPHDCIEAHCCLINRILKNADLESLVYLSGTRLYLHSDSASESDMLGVNPNIPEDIYNISKLAGEAICLADPRPSVRVLRLSNVFGDDFESDNFFLSVLKDAVDHGRVLLGQALDSAKDYVHVDDVVAAMLTLSGGGQHRVYNVASGANTSHGEIMDALAEATGCSVEVTEGAQAYTFPPIDTTRIAAEMDWRPEPITRHVAALVEAYREHRRG